MFHPICPWDGAPNGRLRGKNPRSGFCVLEEDANKNFELRMTPTSLDLDSINYSFVRKQGRKAHYENKALNHVSPFDLASTKPEQSQDPKKKWACKRYEPY